MATPSVGEMPAIIEVLGIPGVLVGGRFRPLIAGAEDTPPADPPSGDPPPADPPKPDDDFDKDRAMATIAKLRGFEKLSKDQTKELDALKAKLQQFEDANKSELEKAQTKAAELEQKLRATETKARERAIRAEVRVQASELGFADPGDAWRFLDAEAIELDDDGEPKNVKKLLEDLLKAKPYLAKQAAQGAASTPNTPKANGQPTREQLIQEKMDKLKASGSYGRW